MKIKLSTYAKNNGIHYQTAWRWFQKGLIPGATQAPTGTVFIEEPATATALKPVVVCYCRVSNQSRRKELQYQVDRCLSYCAAKGYAVDKVFKEVASGMNDNRKELWAAINAEPTIIVVENKDRLTRFGFNYIEKLLLPKCTIEVISPAQTDEQDLIKDMISVVTSFCCRLYGLRRAKNKVNAVKEALEL